MACASSCRAGAAHQGFTYGQCLRSQGLAVTGLESTAPSFTRERERKFNAELDAYAAARKEGLQPAGTSMHQIDAAKREADSGD